MNPAYMSVRFRVEWPHGGRPVRFGVVTAFNPDGKTVSAEANAAATQALKEELDRRGLCSFPVTGGSPDFVHAEPGFGVVLAAREEAVALGGKWRQEAVFWVEAGRLDLVSCADGSSVDLGDWQSRVSEPREEPDFHFLGNLDLLRKPLLALFCSARCPGGRLLPAFDQAARWRDEGQAVISGFHSPVERDCLKILLRGRSPVVICPARSLERFRVPAEWRAALAEGRMLLLSPFPWGNHRAITRLAARRNEWVAGRAAQIHAVFLRRQGQTEALLARPEFAHKRIR